MQFGIFVLDMMFNGLQIDILNVRMHFTKVKIIIGDANY
jgi:hypothetical protein